VGPRLDASGGRPRRGRSGKARLGPGDHFGEIALIADKGRTATVTAESELRCYGLTRWEFRPVVESNPQVAWKMLEAVARMVREADQRES